jgi:hypothetical protein
MEKRIVGLSEGVLTIEKVSNGFYCIIVDEKQIVREATTLPDLQSVNSLIEFWE